MRMSFYDYGFVACAECMVDLDLSGDADVS